MQNGVGTQNGDNIKDYLQNENMFLKIFFKCCIIYVRFLEPLTALRKLKMKQNVFSEAIFSMICIFSNRYQSQTVIWKRMVLVVTNFIVDYVSM